MSNSHTKLKSLWLFTSSKLFKVVWLYTHGLYNRVYCVWCFLEVNIRDLRDGLTWMINYKFEYYFFLHLIHRLKWQQLSDSEIKFVIYPIELTKPSWFTNRDPGWVKCFLSFVASFKSMKYNLNLTNRINKLSKNT